MKVVVFGPNSMIFGLEMVLGRDGRALLHEI
jgi:hypothetical protein